MSRKKLLVIAGAGATVDCQMPSVKDVHNLFLQEAVKQYPLFCDAGKSLYSFMYETVQKHWNDEKPESFNKNPNFEDILYVAYTLTSYNPFLKTDDLPEITHLNEKCPVDKYILQSFSQSLIDRLLNEFRNRCRLLNPPLFQKLANFFTTLSDHFDIAVVTTNYDNVLYKASGKLETGFDCADGGRFKQERILHHRSWPCILHLHGSVHFDMRNDNGNLHSICWQEDLNKQFQQNSSGRSPRFTNEGMTFPTSNIIAGYGKTTQLLQAPFRTYYSELDRLIFESDAVLFMGYGFGDNHLNEAFSEYRDKRNRKVVIIDYVDGSTAQKTCNSGAGFDGLMSVIKAMGILKNSLDDMTCLGHNAPICLKDLIEAQEFERSTNQTQPLSIWYSGTSEACQNADKILGELNGRGASNAGLS